MKRLEFILSDGHSDWQAMLSTTFKYSENLVEILNNSRKQSSVWEINEVIPFTLIGDRTWDLSTEEMEELGYDGFTQKYPHGKPLHQPGHNGEEFRDILNWGSIINTEHTVTEEPVNGGGHTFRIISPRLKKVLDQFDLPPHRFYPAEVTHEITGKKRPYFLFHLTYELGDYKKNAYWEKMEVNIIKKGQFDFSNNSQSKDAIMSTFKVGSLKGYKDFQNKFDVTTRELANIPLNKTIDFTTSEGMEIWDKLSIYDTKIEKYVYKEPYDLLAFDTTLVISESLKASLDDLTFEPKLYLKYSNMVDIITNYQD